MERRDFLFSILGTSAMMMPRAPLHAWSRVASAAHPTLLSPRPVPSASQLRWQRDELAMFVHFGINTFTNREWGDGTEDPALFDPTALDAMQWARVARDAGFRAMILTAKHHDGFCLWPTATTRHSVASSRWRGGAGDVVREFVTACRTHGLRAGLYCSPWDRNHPAYGDSPRYNDVYIAQLTELLTRYGDISEVWFDGANGEGPNGKRQTYDWPRIWATVRRLQPRAVMFSDAGPDVRWVGNERGVAGITNWSTIHANAVQIGASGDDVIKALQEGHADGDVWRPAETDVSIRPGWFYHPAEDARVRSAARLVDLYLTSVGRNSKLLLNVPPTPQGLLHDADIASLKGMHSELASLFARERSVPLRVKTTNAGALTGALSLTPRAPTTITLVDLREPIEHGQRVDQWQLEARTESGWQQLLEGTTIGYRCINRIPAVRVHGVRLRYHVIEGPVRRVAVNLYSG